MSPPVAVFAHRGASAWLPEHTLAAYARAMADGADAIEPDLVSTSDGVLVARHENEISVTTDVASHPEFAYRRTRKCIDGEWLEGWFTEDFSLSELKTLRVRERLPHLRGSAWDGQFCIPTFDEILDLVSTQARTGQRAIGVVPEIKHPSHFQRCGLAMEQATLKALQGRIWPPSAPLMIQSFEVGNLRHLRRLMGDDRRIQLLQLIGNADARPADSRLAYREMLTPAGLARIATYADAIGVEKTAVMGCDATGRLSAPSSVTADAHAAGLNVVVYTFRPENSFLPGIWREGAPAQRNENGAQNELAQFLAAGIDAVFADDPGLARQAVDAVTPSSSGVTALFERLQVPSVSGVFTAGS